MTDQEQETLFTAVYDSARPYILRILRSSSLALVAIWLSSAQGHADYSEWLIGISAFLLSVINRYHWVAGMLILWLVTLYLVPPDTVSWLKAMRG